MSRFMSVVWIIQYWFLLAATVLCLVWPQGVLSLATGCEFRDDAAEPSYCWDSTATPDGRVTTYTLKQKGPGLTVTWDTAANGLDGMEECSFTRILQDSKPVCAPSSLCGSAPVSLPPCGDIPQKALCTPADLQRCVVSPRDLAGAGLLARVRLFAPFLLALMLLSMHALMRGDESIRRSLSSVFAVAYVCLAEFIYTDSYSRKFLDRPDVVSQLLCATVLAFAPFAIYKSFRSSYRMQRRALMGIILGYALVGLRCYFSLKPQGSQASLVWVYVTLGLVTLDLLVGGFEQLLPQLFSLAISIPSVLILLHNELQEGASPLADRLLTSRVSVYIILVLTFAHVLYAFWPLQTPSRRLSGSANTLPSALWVFWLLQGLFFWTVPLTLWAMRSDDHWSGYINVGPGSYPYKGVYGQLDALFLPLILCLGLLSFVGMRSSREWFWKSQCMIFGAANALMLVTMLLVWDDNLFRPWAPVMGVPAVLFLCVNTWFYFGRRQWLSEDVGEGPDGWVLIDLVVGPLFMLRTFFSGRRATHSRGLTAVGTLKVLPNAGQGEARRYPEHELFKPGREFDLHVRLSNESSRDDAAADARGAAVRLWRPDRTPLDLLFSTGAYSTAENILEYGLVVLARAFGVRGRRWLARVPRFREGMIAALRRSPSSYTQLIYYSQLVRFWVAENNERYLVRYRLVPEAAFTVPDWKESGVEVTREDFIHRERQPGDARPIDYLRRDLKLLLEGEREARFRLQAQFHHPKQGNDVHWYNPGVDWSQTDHPWVDLAVLSLAEVVPAKEAERLFFNPDNAPASLGMPVSHGFFDYRSIGDSQRRVMRRVQRTREWMLEAFGAPSPSPAPVEIEELSL